MMTDALAAADAPAALHVGGHGTPLVLLHGIGGTWEAWKPVLPALEARHWVVAPTLPGHHGGPAYAGSGDATVAGLADQLIAMLRVQGIDSAHVAGNSLGGWLALELARRGFARSVTALSPAGGWRTDADYRAVATPFRIFYALVGMILLLVKWFVGSAWLRKTLAKQTMQHGERIAPADFLAMLRGMAKTSVMRGMLLTMGRDGPIAPLDPGPIPVIVAWGEHDRVIPFERYGAPWVERVPGATLVQTAGAGHVPMYDNPEGVVAHILSTTASVDRATTPAEKSVA
jgi:pimeloyl-ACP methyl ester carboxylesterase